MTFGLPLIAGIDEAGRGALAGPVVAGACLLQCEMFKRRRAIPCWSPFAKKADPDCLIADSKMLSPEERDIAYQWITENCAFGMGAVSAFVIEKRGILWATNHAMLLALEDLRSKTHVDSLLIDGRDKFSFPLPHRSIIRGDSLEPCIAAGSIVAKVTRDRLMREYAIAFPQYGFEGHKGYGSEGHIAAIRTHGPCTLHRNYFLRGILAKQELPLEVKTPVLL